MNRKMLSIIAVLAIYLFSGCATTNKLSTEEGYMPSHAMLGEVYAYNLPPSINLEDLTKLVDNFLTQAMYDQKIPFIKSEEVDSSPITPDQRFLIDLEISFQTASRDITEKVDVQITYTLKRSSDNAVWKEGSARSSDWMVSQAASVDSQTAIRYGLNETVKHIGVYLTK